MIDALRNRPIEERIMAFRRSFFSTLTIIVMLAGINILTSAGFPWVIFPAFGLGMGLLSRWNRLWSEGVTFDQVFGRDAARKMRAAREAKQQALARGGTAAAPAPDVSALAASLAPAEVLAGAHGAAVRRAAADRATVLGVVDSLASADRDLIPDVVPTVNALAERVGAVAQLLHHFDADVSPRQLLDLDARIAAVQAEPADRTDRERRLSLLERQRSSLAELSTRRDRLVSQLDSAGIALQNLKYDLLKLRSAGVQSAMADVNSATIEARALSKEIGHVLEAADEVRKI